MTASVGFPQPEKRRTSRTEVRATAFHNPVASPKRYFLKERSWNVVENKGPLWKTWERSWNVYENKGAYPIKSGMSKKRKELSLVAGQGD
jgi:hypothetical protein